MGVVVGKRKFQKRTTTAIKNKDLMMLEQALKSMVGASLQDMAQASNRKPKQFA
jgi:hypothetical protein